MSFFRRGALIERFTTTATSGGTLTLTNTSTTFQTLTGTLTHTVALPDATTLDGTVTTGAHKFYLVNRSTGIVAVVDNSGAVVATLNSNTDIVVSLQDRTTAAGVWRVISFAPQEQPVKLSANTGADSKIKIAANTVRNIDGTDTNTPPISSNIPTFALSTHDLQTGATTGATFTGAALPSSTVGLYRRFGYTLITDGSVQVLYTAEAASIGALANPGTIFVSTGIPIGWIDVEATASTAFKTIGSATSIIENVVAGVSRIHRFGSGGGGGSGSGSGSPLDPDQESTYAFYARSDFNTDVYLFAATANGATFVGTATDQIRTASQIKFTSNTGIFTSSNLVGTQLQTEALAINRASVRLLYENGYVETPTLSISRDGGATYNAITDSLLTAKGNKVVGDYAWSGTDTLSSGTISTAQTGINGVGTVITPAYNQVLSAIDFYLSTASVSNTPVNAYLYLASGGTITGSVLATASETKLLGTDITSTPAYCRFTFASNYTLLAGSSYVIVVRDQDAAADTDLVGYTTTSSASWNTSGLTWNGTTSNTYTTNANKYATKLYSSGVDLRIKVQSSGTYTGNTAAESHLKGFGVDFVWMGNFPMTGDAKSETRFITSTEASTGTITLQGVSYTPGMNQLIAYSNLHTYTANDFTELSSNQVQFAAGALTTGDKIRFVANMGVVDGSSIALGKVNVMYDAVVGSAAQVSSGYAQYSVLQSAINAVAAGGKIYILSGTYTENITVNKELNFIGKGRSTVISGTWTMQSGAIYSIVENMKITGNITFNSGASGIFFRNIFTLSSATVTDNGTANAKLIIVE